MKPPLFDYMLANSADEAVQQLAATPGAMVLAGGQSLIPAMNFRLANPVALVDITRISDLGKIEIADGVVNVGATVKHRDLEQDNDVFRANPLIRAAMAYVAHVPIRNRGTTVGSLCHADAAAEMPMVLLLTEGWVTAQGPDGVRRIDADDFFQFHMTTARKPDELIIGASFPALPDGAGWGFAEFARRKGDYAIAGVGAIIETDSAARVTSARVAACGVGSRPVRLEAVEKAIVGSTLSDAVLAEAGEAAKDAVTAPDDANATNAYRRHLLAALTNRVLKDAWTKAGKGGVQ